MSQVQVVLMTVSGPWTNGLQNGILLWCRGLKECQGGSNVWPSDSQATRLGNTPGYRHHAQTWSCAQSRPCTSRHRQFPLRGPLQIALCLERKAVGPKGRDVSVCRPIHFSTNAISYPARSRGHTFRFPVARQTREKRTKKRKGRKREKNKRLRKRKEKEKEKPWGKHEFLP